MHRSRNKKSNVSEIKIFPTLWETAYSYFGVFVEKNDGTSFVVCICAKEKCYLCWNTLHVVSGDLKVDGGAWIYYHNLGLCIVYTVFFSLGKRETQSVSIKKTHSSDLSFPWCLSKWNCIWCVFFWNSISAVLPIPSVPRGRRSDSDWHPSWRSGPLPLWSGFPGPWPWGGNMCQCYSPALEHSGASVCWSVRHLSSVDGGSLSVGVEFGLDINLLWLFHSCVLWRVDPQCNSRSHTLTTTSFCQQPQ